MKAPWQHKYIVVTINGVPSILAGNTDQSFPGRRITYVSCHDKFSEAVKSMLQTEMKCFR